MSDDRASASETQAPEDRPASEPKEPRWLRVVGLLARLGVGGVFVFAGAQKLLDPLQFAEDIANYQAFPDWSLHLAAALVPVTEIIAGLAVLTNVKRRAGALVLGALTVAFLALIFSIIWRDIDLSCGCFGKADEASAVGWPKFVFDLGLLAAIVVAYLPAERPWARLRSTEQPS